MNPPANERPYSLFWPMACAWALGLLTFSVPGREGPESASSLDVIALAKLGARLGSLLLLGGIILSLWNTSRMRAVLAALLPFGLYAGWALLSTGWSALPAVSFGQALSLLVQLMLAAVIGVLWRDSEDTSMLLRHLSWLLLGLGAVLGAVDLINHDLSGLNREDFPEDGSSGLYHPTSAGATASLGLVLVVSSWLLWGWSWSKRLLFPALAIHTFLLILANSRTAMGMALLVLAVICIRFSAARALAVSVLLASLLGVFYVSFDPELELAESMIQQTSSHVSRGESTESMTSLTGRTALWDAVWAEWYRSPLIGHGYFVTSHNGLLDVWSGPENRSAHNVFLQVLVTTGMVGLALFLWAMGRLITSVIRVSQSSRTTLNPLPTFLGMLGLWYLGWGQLCESFMGPIQPETVVFFVGLGLSLGLISSPPTVEELRPEVRP